MKILIVDDNNEYRRLLRRILEEQQDLTLVGEASDGEEGVRLAHQLKPDVILMDIDMPGTNGQDEVQSEARIVYCERVAEYRFAVGLELSARVQWAKTR
jgi:YesN/AraC family two-component response regulator